MSRCWLMSAQEGEAERKELSSSVDDRRKQIIANYRREKDRKETNPLKRAYKWLKLKQLQFDSTFGGTVYDTVLERTIIYLIFVVGAVLIAWGAFLQLQTISTSVKEAKTSFLKSWKSSSESAECAASL
ncbi:hypothetical protein BSKO_09779 [Bryopsis sp. KO-2023]|nr:hypothetical protein BSKO_09779 [Bryopsis sp. KO-2023]